MNVALLAEGVDRNACSYETNQNIVWSPSSRRAWIEISRSARLSWTSAPSPSSRRAWIEIYAPNTIKRAAL